MADLTGVSPRGFIRDRLTWLTYLSLSVYAFYLYALGPVVAFLRQELHLSYTVASLHSTLWALGAVATGLGFHIMTRRFGRRRVFWLSAAATILGALLFIVGHQVVITLLAALVLGTGGTFLGSGSSVALADQHGVRSDRALVEANVGASLTSVAVPALIGLLAATAAGWRAALVPPLLALLVLFVLLRRLPFPPQSLPAAQAHRLPRAFRALCILVALAVAIEFCIIFFGVPLLVAGTGLPTAAAAATMSLFFAGELTGRLAGARITRRPGRSRRVIAVALAVAMGGFLLLWFARAAALAGGALFVTGLGVANLYPLSIALALGASGGMTDRAMARTQVFLGVAILTAPLLLGVLADRVGVLPALAVEPGLILAAAMVLLAALTGERRLTRPAAA